MQVLNFLKDAFTSQLYTLLMFVVFGVMSVSGIVHTGNDKRRTDRYTKVLSGLTGENPEKSGNKDKEAE